MSLKVPSNRKDRDRTDSSVLQGPSGSLCVTSACPRVINDEDGHAGRKGSGKLVLPNLRVVLRGHTWVGAQQRPVPLGGLTDEATNNPFQGMTNASPCAWDCGHFFKRG